MKKKLDSILWDVKNIKKTIFRVSFLFMFKWSAKYERKFCVFLHIMYIHETLSGVLNKNLPINSCKRANLLSQWFVELCKPVVWLLTEHGLQQNVK